MDSIADEGERERRRGETEMQRQSTQEELLRLLQSEQERWARDRRYEEFLNEGTCCRAFFDDVREARVHSHIEKLQNETGTGHQRGMGD